MVLVEFAMFPTDKGDSVSKYVSQIIDYIDKSGVNYQLTSMGTILEGEWEEVLSVISNCFKILESFSDRIYATMTMDYRKGRSSGITAKVEKIQNILDRNIKIS